MIYIFVAISAGCVLYFLLRPSELPEVVRQDVFTCPAMNGYVFQYPVFVGLENVFVKSENNCELIVNETDKDWPIFRIGVSLKEQGEIVFDQVNQHGVSYARRVDTNEYTFKLGDPAGKVVSISIVALPMLHTRRIQMMTDSYAETIVDSLRPGSVSLSE